MTLARRVVDFFSYFLLYLIVAIALGIASEHAFTEQVAVRYFAKMLAPVLAKRYEEKTPAYLLSGTQAKTPQDLVSVILVQDPDLETYNEPYPVRYRFWARRLAAIAEHNPRAVFIDLFFIDKRNDDTLKDFVKAGCDLREAGVPVYIGSLKPYGIATRPEIADARIAPSGGGAAVPCFTETAIPKPADQFDQSAWEYRLYQQASPGKRNQAAEGLASVAARIFIDAGGNIAAEHAEPLSLVWGGRPHPGNAALRSNVADDTPLKCAEAAPGWPSVLWDFGKRVLGVSDKAGYGESECFYHQTRPISFLRAGDENDMRQMIEGKVVMIGVDLAGMQDVVYSPVAERPIAGVYLHAMALDNLFTFGSGYKRHEHVDFLHEWPFNAATWFATFALILICLAAALVDMVKAGLAQHAKGKGDHDDAYLATVDFLHVTNPVLLAFHVALHPPPALKEFIAHAQAQREGPMSTWDKIGQSLVWVRKKLKFLSLRVLLLGALSCAIFYLGFEIFGLGPLTWTEFVFFPILGHFLKVVPELREKLIEFFSAGVAALKALSHQKEQAK